MLVALCIASFIFGVVVTLFIQTFIIRRKLLSIPVEPITHKPQFVPYTLPKELLTLISDPDQKGQKESCVALNLIIQFLFRELRDSNRVRRWVTKKMNVEFNDMLQSTTGKLIDKITLRDFNLGSTFPVINCVAVDTVKLQQDESIEELDIMADLDYRGGFQIAVEIDLVFKKWAYLSVTITKLKGTGRLQFTRKPYTHWSFTFYEDPEIEFEVESKFGGRPVPQVTSLIISQIKRILRKRHTLPHYKMRYKPFFSLPEELIYQKDLSVKGNLIGQGQLEVKVIGCSRLLVEPANHFLFCTLSVDKLRWLEYEELRKKVWVVYEVKIVKGTAQSIGLSFKEDFMLEKYEDVVVVDNVVPDSPAAVTDIRKGDVLVSVGMTRITSVTQAAKILRNVNDRVTLRLERAKTGTDELVKDSEASKQKDVVDVVRDDFVNIVIKPCESDEKLKETGSTPSTNQINSDKNTSASTPSSPHRKVLSLVNTGKALLQRRVKSNTVSEGSATTISQSDDSLPRSSSGHRISRSMDSRQLINSMNVQHVSGDQSLSPPRITKSAELIQNRNNSDPGFVLVASREPSDVSSDEDDDLDHINHQQEVKQAPPDGSSSKSEDVEKPNLNDMQKTSEVRSKVNPEWNEDFIFNTSSENKYLNVCVWCRIPPKLDKHEKVTKPGRESLIGHISLPLSDISLDCLMTIQRDSQRCVKLVPPENMAGVSRAKFQEYMGHIGFDHRMCHGDITLGFKYGSAKTSDSERNIPVVTVNSDKESSEEVVSLANSEGVDEKIRLEIGKHDFTAKQFHSATYCHFCGKKIWLKDAFQCYTCSMICHKKCVVRCQTQTLCTKDGAMMRSNPFEKWNPPITESRRRQVQRSGPAAILSKFRKDVNLESKLEVSHNSHSPQASPKPSPQPSPKFVRRRNSAPGTDDIISGTFLDVTNIPQTRSSTSLQTLLNTGALPRRLSEELFGNKDKGDSSDDSDSESSSILQLSKHRAKGQNLDEMVVTAAKEMGRELYAELSLEERKQKLDAMVSKFQKEIDIESENKTEMIKEEMETVDLSQKEALVIKISKSDEKVEALMMMMLHYCAGLQYCLDQEEEERRKVKDGNEQIKGIETDLNVLSEQTIEVRKLTEKIHHDSEQKQTKFMSRELYDSIESSSSDSGDLVLVRGDRTSIDENPEILSGREEAVYDYTDRDTIKEEKHYEDTQF